MTNKKAFTLVELLVVMATVAILAAVAVPSYMESVAQTRLAEAKISLSQIAEANKTHFSDYARTVTTNTVLTTAHNTSYGNTDIGKGNITFGVLVKYGYIKKIDWDGYRNFQFYVCNASTGLGNGCCQAGRLASMKSTKSTTYCAFVDNKMEVNEEGSL